jgi:hypothetical protein
VETTGILAISARSGIEIIDKIDRQARAFTQISSSHYRE